MGAGKMKMIEIPEDLYDSLMDISKEMRSQDNRSTASPFIFQVRERKKVYDSGLNGDHQIFFYDDTEIDSVEDLIEYYLSTRSDLSEEEGDEKAEEIRELWENSSWTELEEWADENCPKLDRLSYSWVYVYSNAFFTARGCQEHIERNGHHYNEGSDYLSHAWRNPEMEAVYKFLLSLSDGEEEK